MQKLAIEPIGMRTTKAAEKFVGKKAGTTILAAMELGYPEVTNRK